MSYASAASHYTPAGQPQPDQALLNTEPSTASNVADDSAKVNLVSSDFKENPETTTSTFALPAAHLPNEPSHKRSKAHSKHGHHNSKSAEQWFSVVKEVVLRPTVAGGLVGVVNLGVIGYAGYTFYAEPNLRKSPQALSATLAGSVLLLGFEGYGAERFRQNEGKDDTAVVAQYFRENPGMFQGLLGVLNVGVMGVTGYLAYANWNKWDKRTVSAITGGIFTLWAGEGYLLSTSRDS